MEENLDALVRRVDPDRWMSSRFVAEAAARADLITLYALEAELLAIPTRVSEPMLAEMRYAWWREQLDGVFEGAARTGHPVLEALTAVVTRHSLDRAPFEALIEAHIDRVHDAPHDLDAFYVAPMQLAVQILAGPGHRATVVEAGRLWGLLQTGQAPAAQALKREANRALKSLPVAAFPAVAHAALGQTDAPEAIKRLRLIWSVATGRI